METLMEALQSIGVFLGGVLARLGIFLGLLLAVAVPLVAIALLFHLRESRRRKALGLRKVAGLVWRPDLSYAPGHTWLHRRRGGTLEIGLDDLAQRLLTSVTAVELPRPGTRVERGDLLATLHGGGRAVRIPAPISGMVAGVNAAVLREPGIVKREAYGRGWLVAIAPEDAAWEQFPRGASAESFLRRESERWSRFLEERLGFASADGGELVSPAPWLVGEEGWAELTATFLAAGRGDGR